MTSGNEAFSRVVIDAQLGDQGWNTQDRNSVRYEIVLPDRTRADYVLCDRRFQDEKQITITTLQSMINIYGDYSSGYFDLIISDEYRRSIYGKWSGTLKHFDGIHRPNLRRLVNYPKKGCRVQ